MSKKKKAVTIIISILIAISILVVSIVYYFFFDINRIKGEELIAKSVSPNNTYTVEVYKNNGNATTACAVLCVLHYIDESKKDRNIYWDYPCSDATVEWKDEDTVIINGKTINDVTKDKYDFRSE